MKNLKDLYKEKINIMQYFRENGVEENTNSLDAILVSYDYQAGSYTANYNNKTIVKNTYLQNGEYVDMTAGEYIQTAAKAVAKSINTLSFSSLLEVGMGEATTVCDILKDLPEEKQYWAGGIELSLSRLLYARKFEEQKGISGFNQAVGDMFSLPFEDNSIDLIFTYYCIAENRGKEEEAINEMLRVANKYVVLIEPSYELGNEETKERIDKMCYIKNLMNTLEKVDAKVLEHRLFDIFTYNTNSAITILEKKHSINKSTKKIDYACPICKKSLIRHKENLFCEDCYNIYPVIDGIPLLTSNNAILCSKYTEF